MSKQFSGFYLRPPAANDWRPVSALLQENSLPLDGVKAHLSYFTLAIAENQVVGTVGTEIYGSTGLYALSR